MLLLSITWDCCIIYENHWILIKISFLMTKFYHEQSNDYRNMLTRSSLSVCCIWDLLVSKRGRSCSEPRQHLLRANGAFFFPPLSQKSQIHTGFIHKDNIEIINELFPLELFGHSILFGHNLHSHGFELKQSVRQNKKKNSRIFPVVVQIIFWNT